MEMELFDPAPDGSELARWTEDGDRKAYSNTTSWTDPDSEYLLEVTVDDPVEGYLVRLFRVGATNRETRSSENRIAQTVCGDHEMALDACCRLAAAADELTAVDDDPILGPEYPDMEIVEHPDYTPTPPEEWQDTPDQWEDKMQEAHDKADEPLGRPTLTTKEIDGTGYYYLQWRNGDRVESQYVAPVEP
jgi:hypothetical protein